MLMLRTTLNKNLDDKEKRVDAQQTEFFERPTNKL